MNTKSSISAFSGKSKALAVTLLLGGTLTLSASIVADASVSEKDASVSAKSGFIQQTKQQKQELSEKWGIELVAMRSAAAGHMVDFRYRVLDAEKAAPLFKRQTKPYLIHQGSGKVLAVPNTAKIGSLRNSNTPQNGRIYWMFFGNHHRLVQKGDKVTVAIGDFRATDLVVE
jgi:hypothetical protein